MPRRRRRSSAEYYMPRVSGYGRGVKFRAASPVKSREWGTSSRGHSVWRCLGWPRARAGARSHVLVWLASIGLPGCHPGRASLTRTPRRRYPPASNVSWKFFGRILPWQHRAPAFGVALLGQFYQLDMQCPRRGTACMIFKVGYAMPPASHYVGNLQSWYSFSRLCGRARRFSGG